MGFLDAGLRDGNRFLSTLVAHATQGRLAVAALEAALGRMDVEATGRLRALAADSTERRRVLIDELHETFATPLNREDIYNLSQSLEKMAGYALTTAEEMYMLHVSADEPIRRMVALVREQAEELELAMQRLAKNPRVAGEHVARVQEKEREVERLYRGAIRDLFAHATDLTAMPAVFYRREVYRHISNMADRALSAASVLGMVVMKVA